MHARYHEQIREQAVDRSAEEVVVRHHDTVDDLADDSLERTQQTLATLIRTDQICDATLEELESQGEQLKNAQVGVDNILYQQELAKRHERSIRSFWGWLYNQFAPKPVHVDHTADQKPAATAAAVPAPARNVSITNSGVNTLFAGDTVIDKRKMTTRQKIAASDNHLAQMSDVLSGLHHKSMLMNDELGRQTDNLKVLNKTTDDANITFDGLNRKISTL